MAAMMAASFRRLRPTRATMSVMTSLRPAHSMRPSVTPYFCKAEAAEFGGSWRLAKPIAAYTARRTRRTRCASRSLF
jgi:hypothetical protein